MSDRERNRTDNKRTTEREREREREDLHQPAANRNRYTTPMDTLLIIVGQNLEQRYVSCISV